MSKLLKEKINELVEQVKDLRSLEAIEPYCKEFREWLESQNYNNGSLGTVLSREGFYKAFNSLPLEQGKNAVLVEKKDFETGRVKGNELKHYAVILCGLSKEDWDTRNSTDRVVNRLGQDNEIDPNKYLEVASQLLASEDPHELAIGLIAVTGRRPHEILVRGSFTPIEGEQYQVKFSGQGKKRGQQTSFKIATLYPANYVITCLRKLRNEPSTKALLVEVERDFPGDGDIAAQNRAIDSRRNGSLNRVVRSFFGDKGDSEPVLAFRYGEEQDNCKALRAAYACLATARDCKGSVGSQMFYYAKLLGHIDKPKEEINDSELQHIVTSVGYADYFCNSPVAFPLPPAKPKTATASMRVEKDDLPILRELQEKLGCENQQSVISRLIDFHQKGIAKILELEAQISQLQKEKKQMSEAIEQLETAKQELQNQPSQSTESATVEVSQIEAIIERLLEKKLQSIGTATAIVEQSQVPIQTTPKPKVKEVIDWEAKSNEEVWTLKGKGVVEEKIRRSYLAITTYNDTLATGDDDRLAITNQVLRELSGTNGLVVGDWLRNHADEVISHNAKYEMANAKDPSKIETYYNKRHGADKVSKILELINSECLDGAAKV